MLYNLLLYTINKTMAMSTEENVHSITEDISDLDLGKENADKTTLEEKSKEITGKHDLQVPQKPIDRDQTTLKSYKEQEMKVEKDCDNSSVSTNENRGDVEDPITSKSLQGQEDPNKDQEKIHATSTTPAENEEENSGTGKTSKVINEVECQEDIKQTTTESSIDLKSQEDENDPKPTKEAKYPQIVDKSHPKPTTTSKDGSEDIAETSENVIKKRDYRWFRCPKTSKVDKSQKNDVQKTNAEAKPEDKRYDIQHVNICGSYLLAIGLMFICVVVVLGGFIWRIVYAIGGYHEDFLKATDCPTMSPPSNDSNDTHHSVLKVLQKMWRNESNEQVSD